MVARTSRRSGQPAGWFADFKRSGGVVLDLLVHDFDWLRWSLGRVTRVFARAVESGVPSADYALVTLRFQSGAIAHVEGSWARPSGFETCVEIAGTNGVLSYSSKESAPLNIEMKSMDADRAGLVISETPSGQDPYYLELEHFIDCLEQGKQAEITARDALEAVRISGSRAQVHQCGPARGVGLAALGAYRPPRNNLLSLRRIRRRTAFGFSALWLLRDGR